MKTIAPKLVAMGIATALIAGTMLTGCDEDKYKLKT